MLKVSHLYIAQVKQKYFICYCHGCADWYFLLCEGQEAGRFQFIKQRDGVKMRILYELSWLWKTLGIALAAAAVCAAGALLICRAAKKIISGKITAAIGIAAFVIAIVVIILLARTPRPL